MEEQKNRAPSWVWIALAAAIIVSLACGLFFGGIGGFVAGRRVGRLVTPTVRREYRVTPLIPRLVTPPPAVPTPGVPEVPVIPGLTYGALVTYVEPNSPAAEAGLQIGDVIYQVNGKNLSPDNDLAAVIGAHKPGDRVTLTVLRVSQAARGQATVTISVTLGANPNNASAGYLGVRIVETTPQD